MDAFLARYQIRVRSKAEMAALRATPEFQIVYAAMMKAGQPKHHADILHASYAAALKIPFIADGPFTKWVMNSLLVGKGRAKAKGVNIQVMSILEFATSIGIRS
jgi:hypothetical protein